MEQSIQISSVAITIVLLAIFILAIYFRKRSLIFDESKNFTLPDPIPLTGVDVPNLGTYGGIKGLGLLAISENNFNPRLTLYDDYMDYKVLVSKSADYSQIKSVQEISFLFFSYLKISFYDRILTLGVRLVDKEIMHKITDFFHNRGIPVKSRSR